MASLASSVLADFSDDEEDEGSHAPNQQQQQQQQVTLTKHEEKGDKPVSGLEMDACSVNGKGGAEALRCDIGDPASFLARSGVEQCMKEIAAFRDEEENYSGPVDDSKAYRLVVRINMASVEIDAEVSRLYAIVVEQYSKRFPDLAAHVPEPVEYLRAVKLIQNEKDMSNIDFSSELTPAQTMVISMTGSRLTTAPLEPAILELVLRGCSAALELCQIKTDTFLPFVTKQMPRIAPNITELLGADLTAQLLALVGGLGALVQIPSSNVQVIGKSKMALHGFSRVASMRHFGLIIACPLVEECLPEHRVKAMRKVAGRVALASRVDLSKSDPSGSAGKAWADQIRKQLTAWHAPGTGRLKRALKAPQTDTKRKRGGRRARALKEKLGLTEVRKQANRMQFGTGDDEYGDSAMGNTFGMLGKDGSGQVRIVAKEQKKSKALLEPKAKSAAHAASAQRRALLSSLSGTAVDVPKGDTGIVESQSSNVSMSEGGQEIQLKNPDAKSSRALHSTKYFGSMNFRKPADSS
mmetsp:Transcript_16830/g.30911  ORF Transcript_16830/g.30911 Transcript_16830/m.30911 type:complete len:524 (-) Transcript_16830:18-1589(-)